MSKLTDQLRESVKLRFNKVSIKDFITMCQQAADRIDELEHALAGEPTPAVFRSNRNPMHLTDAEFLNDFEEEPNGHS